ncbi:hypothetical protein C8A03DRAFT_17795 [Achaetomium macrosporum]|uniref:Clr5 domain-containing protein n=1 Tax=Achaetomium macrosporum TaxID=79813 RepID=A0AAN7C663_9PEZI|nr:hypothetical protein C8A03DRAFT_17795 [Achaetomium macrosporum]
MTKQWDKYREIIIAEYKDQNKPLHEVQRVMMEKYGFRASTRAYRSRFDRWGVHKYSRRRRPRSTSPDRRESFCDGAAPDDDENNSQAASPPDATATELLTPGLCVATPEMDFRSPLFQYARVAPSLSQAMPHGHTFSLNQFGGGLAGFNAQNIGCYSSNSGPIYREGPRGMVAVASDASDRGNISHSWYST